MRSLFASWVESWRRRRLGSRKTLETCALATAPAPDHTVSAALAVPEPGGSPAKNVDAPLQSLCETLQLDPAAIRIPHAISIASPAVRERTLDALHNLRQIPALQSFAQGFLQTLSQTDVAVEDLVATITRDSALCVRVLRMANSVLVSPERRIEDIETAVHMLGVKRVRQAAQALFTLRDGNRVAEGFDWRHLWLHALATASIADELERQLRGADNSQVYLAALLHDVGKVVLSTIAPDDYRNILIRAWNDGGRLDELERACLGVDHREAGRLFAQRHGLPAVVIDTIAHHHDPAGVAPAHRFEVALVAIANHVSKAHGLGFSGARVEAGDGELEELPAWAVIERAQGWRPAVESLSAELRHSVCAVREDLASLRQL